MFIIASTLRNSDGIIPAAQTGGEKLSSCSQHVPWRRMHGFKGNDASFRRRYGAIEVRPNKAYKQDSLRQNMRVGDHSCRPGRVHAILPAAGKLARIWLLAAVTPLRQSHLQERTWTTRLASTTKCFSPSRTWADTYSFRRLVHVGASERAEHSPAGTECALVSPSFLDNPTDKPSVLDRRNLSAVVAVERQWRND